MHVVLVAQPVQQAAQVHSVEYRARAVPRSPQRARHPALSRAKGAQLAPPRQEGPRGGVGHAQSVTPSPEDEMVRVREPVLTLPYYHQAQVRVRVRV